MKKVLIAIGALVLPAVLFWACGSSGGGGVVIVPTLVHVTDFQAAGVVIGQPDFVSYDFNQGGSADANTLSTPLGNPAVWNKTLYLPDSANNRVLVFHSVPTANNASADFVLGQPDMTTTSTGTGADQMGGPQTVKAAGGKLFVDEYNNSRVLIWNTAPTTTNTPADVVVGQSGFVTPVSDCTATNLYEPEDIEVVNGKLIVADSEHNRVLIWNHIPTSNGEPADVVLGQGDFTHCTINDDFQTGVTGTATARTLNYPSGIWSNGTKLIITDGNNNRVLIWKKFPTTNFAPADIVVGQGDFAHITANDDLQTNVTGTATARTFSFPYFVDSNGTQLFVADSGNSRVLIWKKIPTSNFLPADQVLGQGDFTHNAYSDDNQDGTPDANPSARTLSAPAGIYVSGSKLFITDNGNSRYLIFE